MLRLSVVFTFFFFRARRCRIFTFYYMDGEVLFFSFVGCSVQRFFFTSPIESNFCFDPLFFFSFAVSLRVCLRGCGATNFCLSSLGFVQDAVDERVFLVFFFVFFWFFFFPTGTLFFFSFPLGSRTPFFFFFRR